MSNRKCFSWSQEGTINFYQAIEIRQYMLPLNPEGPVKTMSKILVQAQQAACHYCLLVPVTQYIQHIMTEKEAFAVYHPIYTYEEQSLAFRALSAMWHENTPT